MIETVTHIAKGLKPVMKMYLLACWLVLVTLPTSSSSLVADQSAVFSDTESLLPPVQQWSGKSEALIVSADDPWVTPAEMTGLTATPSYDKTVAWLRMLVKAAPELEMISIGKSLEGRDFWMVVASNDEAFTPAELAETKKPLLLAHAGIHAGEIDGKDAGLMLLRDMTVKGSKKALLGSANFLFIPILNVDGHERKSPYNRINQRGPVEMGWRTNARNQNLNRDFTKLDTAGVRALIKVFNEWKPDLYLDLHVTDGADYQYDITFGGNGRDGWSPAIGNWIEDVYRPAINDGLSASGHQPGGLIFAVNGQDMKDGFLTWTGDPRFSNGYGDAAHLPTVLVENHSLKPYKRRVLGTYVLMEETLALLAKESHSLQQATTKDRKRRPVAIPLGFRKDENQVLQTSVFKGIASSRYQGEASGDEVVRWTGNNKTEALPEVFIAQPTVMMDVPEAYIVPAAWVDVVDRIRLHGIEVERLEESFSTVAELYRLPDAAIAGASAWTPNPFEGHIRIDTGKPVKEVLEATFPAGSYRIRTDQPLGELLMLMLEPQAPDSFFQWGFFLEIFTRTEYAEAYVLEPLAMRMLEQDPLLKQKFEARLAGDEAFAASPYQRLMWFYQHTPFYDQNYLLYPVARIPKQN